MGNDLAIFVTYGAMLVDGNLITNLLSIGGKTRKTGPDPPSPAIVGGLNTHAVFEGVLSHCVNRPAFTFVSISR
jgi:unspecific peroxygenase